LRALSDYADAEGYAHPAIETLARVTRSQVRSVKRALAQLRTMHTDEFEQIEQGHGRHHASLYRVKLVDRYAEAVEEKRLWKERHHRNAAGDNSDAPSPLNDAPNGDTTPPLQREMVTYTPGNGDLMSPHIHRKSLKRGRGPAHTRFSKFRKDRRCRKSRQHQKCRQQGNH
jgi:hypothetical protein